MDFQKIIEHNSHLNPKIIKAMQKIDRAQFMPKMTRDQAGRDAALLIDCGQTISQPSLVAMMSQALFTDDETFPQKILEIGTGSGYQTAILAALGAEIYSIERHEKLYEQAKQVLQHYGSQIHLKCGNGWQGWQEFAPFDAVIITAALEIFPKNLFAQMRVGGILVAPIGNIKESQILKRIVKTDAKNYTESNLANVVFVPFVNSK